MKLHLGCGKRYLKGFIHIDIASYPHIDFQSSVDNLSFIKNESVSEIYTSHTLEYFDRTEAESVLKEWSRVLIPSGQLFITVPDFDKLIEIYRATNNLVNILGPIYGKWEVSGRINPIFHKTIWNERDLINKLKELNFDKVKSFNPKSYLSVIDPTYDDYSLAYFPHLDSNGIQVSLAISASKPFS